MMSSNRLQKRRIERNMSQAKLAALSGVPVRTIQHYEIGRRALMNASYITVKRLAVALNCDPEDLI